MCEGIVGGPFCRLRYEKINLNSPAQVKNFLLSRGWIPTEFNTKKEGRETIQTSPKLTEDSFDSVKGEVPKLVARRSILVHRQRMLRNTKKNGEESGWLNNLREDGRLEARAIPQATNTGRARHSIVVNVPSPDAVYGTDIRSLFIVPNGYKLFGIDAAALEARCLAHFLLKYPGGKEIANILLEGDIHTENAKLWNCTRKEAKSPLYALLFGVQPTKLATTMGVSVSLATKRFNDFWEHYAALNAFKQDLIKVWKSRGGQRGGFLKGLDGRKLFARSEHSLVNLMIQSTGSVLVKTALVLIDKTISKYNLDAHQIIFMHDEGQFEVREDQADMLKVIAEKCFLKAGEHWKLGVPMVGEGKIADNWYGTH